MIYLIAFLSFVLSFSILFVTRMYLASHRLTRGDTFFHLLLSDAIRKNKWKFPSSLQNVTLGEIDNSYNYLAYPPLFHYLISFFPVKHHEKIAKNFNLFVLSIMSTTTTVLVFDVTTSFYAAIFSGFLVIINFSALSLVVQFSPRSLGILLYSLIISLTIFYPTNFLFMLLIALLITALSLTHKFAIQVLIFSLLPYSILFNQLYLLLSLIIGLFISVLVSKGFYIKIVEEHIRWLRFYRVRPFKAPLKTYVTSIFGSNVWIFVILLAFFGFFLQSGKIILPENLIKADMFLRTIYWAFINIVIAMVISIPALSFLGEYSRYIEYSIVPIAIASSLILASVSPYLLPIAIVCILFTLFAMVKFKKYLISSKSLIDLDDVASYQTLKDHDLSNVLVLPARTLEVNYYSGISVVHPVRGAETPFDQITHLMENYDIRYVLKFRDSDPYQLFATMSRIKKMEKILEFKNFEVYKL
jgi:hypothetical protein